MELKPGYKQTEVGVIPEDWEVRKVLDLTVSHKQGYYTKQKYTDRGVRLVRITDLNNPSIDYESMPLLNISDRDYEQYRIKNGDFLFARSGAIGRYGIVEEDFKAIFGSYIIRFNFDNTKLLNRFFGYLFETDLIWRQLLAITQGSSNININANNIKALNLPLPSTKEEQTAIAEALSDADGLIATLERLIAKKRQIKQGAMQTLLNPHDENGRLKAGWVMKRLGDITECLDNLRIPLNEGQRSKMKGDIPYCGANGIVGYVNDYVIDDDVILMAEDGGYFDEYMYRPIAYRMIGKCWVNNHAHILKALLNYDQGYIFYSLVHKNILSYLASGTRAKLNKSEMQKIEISLPVNQNEQTRIATILFDMDAEIDALETKLAKAREIKQGMMQNLLSGRIRLV